MQTPGAADIVRTLDDLRKAQGPALVIGGLAVIHHGYRRLTEDVDILYAHEDGGVLKRLRPAFKVVLKAKNGWHQLEHRETGVRLELIPEGGVTTYGFIPGPDAVGGEEGFVSLFGLVWLKLVSGRAKDDADVVELAKSRMKELAALRGRLPGELHGRFDDIVARAKREMENDPHRRGR